MALVIVVAGEALIDILIGPDGRVTETPGGGPFTTARAIGRLGLDVDFVGRLSTDARGRRLANALDEDGVGRRHAPSTEAPTTLARAAIDAEGMATYDFVLDGTSAVGLTIDEARAALRVRPAAFHVGSLGLVTEPIASTLTTAVAETSPDTLVMVDPNCRPAAITDHRGYVARLLALLARADIVKASVDDLAFLAPGRPPDEAARAIVAAGAGLVVVTDGPGPVRAVGPAFAFDVSVAPAEVVDSVGAGDAFGGALLARVVERGLGRAGLADADAVHEAVGLASEAARVTCGRPGADPPHRGELDWPSPEDLG